MLFEACCRTFPGWTLRMVIPRFLRATGSWVLLVLRFLRAGGSWVLVGVLFGLLPLWFHIAHAIMFPEVKVGWDEGDVLRDGILIYFSMAIVSAVAADYYLVDEPYPKYYHFYMMFIFPLLLYITSIFLLLASNMSSLTGDHYALMIKTEVHILVGSCVYALVHKGRHILGVETEAELETVE
jgi:hypothetical protein